MLCAILTAHYDCCIFRASEEEARKQSEMKAKMEQEKLDKSRAVLFNFLKKSSHLNQDPNSPSQKEDERANYSIVPNSLLQSFNRDQFMGQIAPQDGKIENLYLNCLLSNALTPYVYNLDSDAAVDDDVFEYTEHVNDTKYVYLRFYENVKPPYFGPKPQHSTIDGRRALAKEPSIDYEVDSDEEWDEGGPGESLSGSDSEQEEKDDYEIDDFLVPHGYLSDDECEDVTLPGEDGDTKTGPLLKEQTLLAERSRHFSQQLHPQVIGCVWPENKDQFPEKFQFLEKFKAVVLSK